MKLEKTIFKISLLEMLLNFGFMLILLNGTIYFFTVIEGNPRLLIYNSSWILQFVFPLIYSIIYISINRNGILKLTMFSDSTTLIKKLETLIFEKGYMIIDTETETFKYTKKKKLHRFLNLFFRENIKVRVTDNAVTIFAKKNLLYSIEMKLKYDHTI